MSIGSREHDEAEQQAARAIIREMRETVADQMHDLVVEREGLGTYGQMVEQVWQIGRVVQDITQVRGQRLQAEEMGLAQAPLIARERELLGLLRATVMGMTAAAGAYVVALDVQARRAEIDRGRRNGRRRRPSDEPENI